MSTADDVFDQKALVLRLAHAPRVDWPPTVSQMRKFTVYTEQRMPKGDEDVAYSNYIMKRPYGIVYHGARAPTVWADQA